MIYYHRSADLCVKLYQKYSLIRALFEKSEVKR
jgi:hypothetical protein